MVLKNLATLVVRGSDTEIEIPNDYNLYNYVFSFGDLVEVLEPEEIRIKIKKMINKIAQKYIT